MDPPSRPLVPSPPRQPDSFDPVEVEFDGARCMLSVDGPFTIAPIGEQDKASAGGCMCCSAQPAKKTVLLSKADVIGAETIGETGVYVWHSQVSSKDPERPTRSLLRTKRIECSTRLEAIQIVRFVRHWAIWGGHHGERRLVAIMNPVSGKGRGPNMFKDDIKPLLEGVCGYMVTCIDTKEIGHATTILADMKDLASTSALVVVGGDGTVHECLQGMLSRFDWEKTSKVPIIQLPVGSANSLSASTGVWDAVTAVHTICKGAYTPLDVMSVVQGTDRHFSFMGLSYGAVSELDKGAESHRWMGETRFTMGALGQILRKKRYGMKIAYLPASELPSEDLTIGQEPRESASGKNLSQKAEVETDQGNRLLTEPNSTGYPNEGEGNAGKKGAGDGGAGGGKDALLFPGVPVQGLTPELAAWFQETVMEGKEDGGAAANGFGDWHTLEVKDVLTLSAMNIPYAATNYHLAPQAKLGNGAMEVLYMSKCSRGQMLDFMMKAEKGNHMDIGALKSQRVSGLWLGPKGRPSRVMADRELLRCEATYVEVHPRLCRVLVASK